jgi:fido (protein-threonine AMPylation protein)
VPIPISHLFKDEDDIHCYPSQKDIEKMSKPWSLIPINIVDFPHVDPPDPSTPAHNEDIRAVKDCVSNPRYSKKILNIADNDPFSMFNSIVKKNNLDVNLEKYEELNDQLSSIVLSLKFKYNRPRPKKYMRVSQDTFDYEKIEDMDTPAYPSGHTAHAFFNATLLSGEFPKYKKEFNAIANVIAHTRVDLGKHYPSDCSFGRYVGEEAAKACLTGKHAEHITIKEGKLSSDQRRTSRDVFYNAAQKHDKKKCGSTYVDELCEFIIQSNLIERYHVDITEALNASKSFMRGLPVEYCTNDKYIRSHLSALETAAAVGKVDSPLKIQQIHKSLGQDVMERGVVGKFRNFEHAALSTGYSYTHPDFILSDLLSWCDKDYSTNFKRHADYECIHPFADGNGRSGRIIFVCDEDFDLLSVNKMIGTQYIPSLVSHQLTTVK